MVLESKGLKGLADPNGNLIKDCQYNEILEIAKNAFQVKKGDNFGVIDIKGTDLVPVSYSKIKVYGSRFYGALPPKWERIKLLTKNVQPYRSGFFLRTIIQDYLPSSFWPLVADFSSRISNRLSHLGIGTPGYCPSYNNP